MAIFPSSGKHCLCLHLCQYLDWNSGTFGKWGLWFILRNVFYLRFVWILKWKWRSLRAYLVVKCMLIFCKWKQWAYSFVNFFQIFLCFWSICWIMKPKLVLLCFTWDARGWASRDRAIRSTHRDWRPFYVLELFFSSMRSQLKGVFKSFIILTLLISFN